MTHFFERKNIKRSNRFEYGSHDLSNIAVIESISRSLKPSIVVSSSFIAGKDGEHFKNANEGALEITVTLRFIEDTYEAVQMQALKAARLLSSDKPQKIVLRDLPGLYNIGIVSQTTNLDKIAHTGSAELVFKCFDNSYYGEEKTIGISGTVEFENEFRKTYGVFNLKTHQTDMIRITLNDGQFLRFDFEFEENADLLIDLEKEFARLNGNLIMKAITLDSDFFELIPGTNKITIEGASGTLTYIERW